MSLKLAIKKKNVLIQQNTYLRPARDPEQALKQRGQSGVNEDHSACTMCDVFCTYKVMDERKK